MKKHKGKIAILAILALLGGSVWYAGQAAERANEGVVLAEKVAGNPDAAVTLTKYSDFQCPACAAASPVVKDILAEYGEEIRFEYKHFPLIAIHPFAVPAASAAEAAGVQGKFFEYHDLLFENQTTWSNSSNPTPFFVQYAEELDLDVSLFRRHLNASLIEDEVRADLAQAQELGLRSTPSFLVNGQLVQLQSYNDLVAAVEAALGNDGATTDATGTTSAATPNPATAGSEQPVRFGF